MPREEEIFHKTWRQDHAWHYSFNASRQLQWDEMFLHQTRNSGKTAFGSKSAVKKEKLVPFQQWLFPPIARAFLSNELNYPHNIKHCWNSLFLIIIFWQRETWFGAPNFRISILRLYNYFEKGCRKKCARDNPERWYGIWSIHCSWHCSCRTYFCCFPLALADISP